ncbi:MAG TPA: nickel-dependent lactate racemase [Armatimonadetes bacterium]|nr:nickel-dependent lactate racemase [Armatimonadota bacterium]
MRVQLEYGRQGLTVELPADRVTDVLALNPATPLPDEPAAIRAALRAPLGGPPLAELARGRRNAVIVICDITRPVPNVVILPEILAELETAGLGVDDITILIATGNHRPNLGDELVELVGADIASRYRILNHHSEVEEEQAFLGNSSTGVEMWVDKTYVEADLKIITGLIEPHFMAGYSGGRKIVCPGLIAFRSVNYFHSPPLMEHPRAATGVLEGNPLHQFALEVCAAAGVDFSVNVVIDAERRIGGVFAGELETAHAAGVAFCDQVCRVPFDEPAEVVLTTSAGYPLDATFYQAVKGMVGALPALKPGGTIIIAAELSEGIGSPEFTQQLHDAHDHESFLAGILAPSAPFTKDQWEVEKLCHVLQVGQVVVVSDKVPPVELERCLVRGATSVEAAVDEALAVYGPAARLLVIPSGPYCIPTPRSDAAC